ncbi:MAG: hypothetical protein JWQ76_2366 [Ramlibacter sp.]|nr:hypothetical protein [Ramlibacter sp.]
MHRKTLIAAALAAGALMGLGTAAQATPAIVAGTTVYVQPAPPAPMYEAVPSARAGYIWAPGHYEWRGDRYEWTTGRWLETRRGWAWQESRWQQRPDGSWYMAGGEWVSADNYSANDERMRERRWRDERSGSGARDRDRDGDGVPNRYDAYPDNPYRN